VRVQAVYQEHFLLAAQFDEETFLTAGQDLIRDSVERLQRRHHAAAANIYERLEETSWRSGRNLGIRSWPG
jgi:hypothetical protein